MKPLTKDIYTYAFAAFFVAGSFILMYLLKDAISPVAIGVIDTLKMGDILILGYLYGSSKSSGSKDETIAKALDKSQTDVANSAPVINSEYKAK